MNAPEEKFESALLMERSGQSVINGNHQGEKLVASPLLVSSCVFRAVLQKQADPLKSDQPLVSPQREAHVWGVLKYKK